LSLTLTYIIFAIVLLHIVAGFAWVLYKMMNPGNGKKKSSADTDNK